MSPAKRDDRHPVLFWWQVRRRLDINVWKFTVGVSDDALGVVS
jgi:hypothetical protein